MRRPCRRCVVARDRDRYRAESELLDGVGAVFAGRDMWLVSAGRVVALVRFPRHLGRVVQGRLLEFGPDWESEVRDRWLVGGTRRRGDRGGRLCCALCHASLHFWESGRLYGPDCVQREQAINLEPDSLATSVGGVVQWARPRPVTPAAWESAAGSALGFVVRRLAGRRRGR